MLKFLFSENKHQSPKHPKNFTFPFSKAPLKQYFSQRINYVVFPRKKKSLKRKQKFSRGKIIKH